MLYYWRANLGRLAGDRRLAGPVGLRATLTGTAAGLFLGIAAGHA
ncbi:MAG TPA: hypothetical protein VMA72_02395 [Streptosporangiaceae bacterium]|nr:hypothetical protein [Streptosporangiaceae bacterium]